MGILTTLLQAITIKANGWSDGGHAINHLYDILFMMEQDHIPVGVGGEGGILPNGTILPNVGGFQPIIDQVCMHHQKHYSIIKSCFICFSGLEKYFLETLFVIFDSGHVNCWWVQI